MAQPRQAQANTLQQEILAYIDRNPVFWGVLIAIIGNFHSAWIGTLLSKFVENLWLLMGVHFVVLLVLAGICFGNKFKDSQKTKKQRFLEFVESKYDALEEHVTDTFISQMEEHMAEFARIVRKPTTPPPPTSAANPRLPSIPPPSLPTDSLQTHPISLSRQMDDDLDDGDEKCDELYEEIEQAFMPPETKPTGSQGKEEETLLE